MRLLSFLAQAPLDNLHPAEVLFFKILSLSVMILWAVYLIKEIFSTHKEDPRLSALIAGMQQNSLQLAVLSTNIGYLTEANKLQQVREDKMWSEISGIRKTLTSMAEEHAHLEGMSLQQAAQKSTRPR